MNFKKVRIQNKELLESYRNRPCVACNRRGAEAHHVTTRGAGGDDVPENLIALCRIHHTEIHAIGPSRMAQKYVSVKNWFMANGRQDLIAGGG